MSEKNFLYFGCVFTMIRLPSDKMSGRRQCKLEAMKHLEYDRTNIRRKWMYTSRTISLKQKTKKFFFGNNIFVVNWYSIT